MKKTIAVLIAAVMLVVLIGCGDNKAEVPKSVTSDLSQNDAYDKYVNAVGAINAADSFSGNIILKTIISIMGEPYEYNATTGVKHLFGSGDNFEAELIADDSQGMDSIHYKNGIFYYTSETEKLKFYYPGEDLLKMTNSRIVTDVLFLESDIFGYEATED